MSKTIEGVPECLTREQYTALFEAVGFDPKQLTELRFARDGVHAVVLVEFPDGGFHLDPHGNGFYKHRVFIPVRDDDDDKRTTTVKPIKTN